MEDAIKKLRAAGATRIEVKPDGTIVAEFGEQPAPVQYVPVPWHQPPVWPYPAYPGIWWGTSTSALEVTWQDDGAIYNGPTPEQREIHPLFSGFMGKS